MNQTARSKPLPRHGRDRSALGLFVATVPPQLPPVEAEVDGFALLRVIRRRARAIVVATAALVLLALPLLLTAERTYYAEARLLIEPTFTTTLADASGVVQEQVDVDSELERIRSRDNVVRVIDQLDLAGRAEFNPALRKGVVGRSVEWLRQVVTGTGPEAPDMSRIVETFYGKLSVWRQGQTNVTTIGFVSEDPKLAAAVPNALIASFTTLRESQRQAELDRASSWIAQQIAAEEAHHAEAVTAAQAFQQTNNLSVGARETGETASVRLLTDQKAAILSERSDVRAALQALDEGGAAPASPLVQSEVLTRLQDEQLSLKRQIDSLTRRYGAGYSGSKKDLARLAETEAAIAGELADRADALRVRDRVLAQQEAEIDAQLAEMGQSLTDRGLAETQMAALLRTVDASAATLDALYAEKRRLDAASERPPVSAVPVKPAGVPDSPQQRGRKTSLLVALFVSLCLAVTGAALWELLDRRLRSQDQLDRIDGVRGVGMLPRLANLSRVNLPEMIRRRPGAVLPEAARGALLAIETAHGGTFPSSLVVTSAGGGEGASFAASALALELAMSGRRVLLIDADLKNGAVHEVLGCRESPGLGDHLVTGEALSRLIRRNADTGLYVVPRGRPRPVVIRDRARVEALLDYGTDHALTVIFDCPPVLSGHSTLLLASMCDATLLVAGWGRSRRQTVELAVRRLRENGSADTVMTLVSNVDLRRHALYGFRDSAGARAAAV